MKCQANNSNSTLKAACLTGLFVITMLTGCVSATTGDGEGIGYRQKRFQEISVMRSYRSCVDDAMKVAEDARSQGHAAGYRRSARIIERCEADLGPESMTLAQEERMRAYAVSILNYVKAGDITNAQKNLETFRKSFGGYDLYLANGSSFIDTMTLITASRDHAQPHRSAMLNISKDLRTELQRVTFWKRN
jgi:hypothetical protein